MDKEKIKVFFKSKYNWTLIAILIFSFFLYFHYYDVNVNNSYWWDESTYLNGAKYWATGHPFWQVEAARPPLFMLMMAFFFKLGLSETTIRFFTVLIPSLLAILATYLLGKEMYGRKTGLISAFMISVFWVFLFNVTRVHTDQLATFLGIMTFYFFWKGYVKSETPNYKLLSWAGLCIGLSFLIRLSSLLPLAIILAFVAILFLFSKDKALAFKHLAKLWVIPLIFVLILIPYAIWGYFQFGNALPWLQNYLGGAQTSASTMPFAWNLTSYIYEFLQWPYLILFLIGLAFTYKLWIGFDLVIKEREKKPLADLFNILTIVIVLAFFIIVTRGAEHRWAMMMAPALFFIASKGILKIYNLLKEHNVALAVFILLAIVLAGSYPHLTQNSSLVENKLHTEGYAITAGQYIKENTKPENVIITANIQAELTYTSERQCIGMGANESVFMQLIKEKQPSYLVLSSYFLSEQWNYEIPEKYPQLLEPAQAYFADEAKTQPVLFIYKFKSYEI